MDELDFSNDLLRTYTHRKFVKTFVDYQINSRFDRNLINGIMRDGESRVIKERVEKGTVFYDH